MSRRSRSARTARHTARRSALLAVVVAVLGVFAAPAAQAADGTGYRYWSFWERDGAQWVYAQQGSATTHPADGAVQGFRFSVSQDSQNAAKPRGDADFRAACAATPAKEGSKRIALVLDFGTPQDAPKGETPPATRTVCAQVAADATTADALAEVAKPLRYNSAALLCAIGGYPKTGCADQVSGSGEQTTAPAPAASDSVSEQEAGGGSEQEAGGGGPSAGLVVGAVAVLLLGGAAVWQARRRRG
ncbi:SCO2322 family protein [Streptomyces sp. NPDC087440]|uniref:SCO2322 family protein n=1 Tax=Streptomyces sp. NPDC087440 TaxID=3365790 RepID=UPI00382899D1